MVEILWKRVKKLDVRIYRFFEKWLCHFFFEEKTVKNTEISVNYTFINFEIRAIIVQREEVV